MQRGPEAKLLAAEVKHLKAMLAGGARVWWHKIHGSGYSPVGVPDLVIVFRGVTLWIENKAPGEVPTKIQQHTADKIDRAGGVVCVVRTIAEFQEALGFHG